MVPQWSNDGVETREKLPRQHVKIIVVVFCLLPINTDF
jgi:hypothetical protein